MRQKKISLRIWMFLKIAPSALLVLMYWTNVRTVSHPMHFGITFIVLLFFGLFSYYDKRADLFDESAKENLKRTDSICLKVAYAFGILSTVGFMIPARLFVDAPVVTGRTIGYGIVFSILFLTILRACIFSMIEKKGI